MIEETIVEGKRLGRLPAKASRKALMFSDFVTYISLPKATNHWTNRTPIPLRSFGNLQYGDCTRAKQAVAIERMERLEQKRTVTITDAEVIRVYTDMSNRLYGGGDNGAYETDALDEWRRPETTIRDVSGHPYTIDAYLRLNSFNHQEIRAGIALSGARGIAVCLNLPLAWSSVVDGGTWDIPEGRQPIGEYLPGSWGGHSMWTCDYDDIGLVLDGTWNDGQRHLTWRAAAIYLDEAHMVIDSVDAWRKMAAVRDHLVNLDRVVEAVNDVSSHKITT